MAITSPEISTPRTPSARRTIGMACLVVGLLFAAFAGWALWTAERGPALAPVPFGSTVVLEQHGIFGATVFATDGSDPVCTVDGEQLTRPPSESVVVDGLRSVRDFPVSFPEQAGRRYQVACTADTTGQFAVVQYDSSGLLALLAACPAVLLLGVGALLLLLRRSRGGGETGHVRQRT